MCPNCIHPWADDPDTNFEKIAKMNEAGQMKDGDILLLLLQGEDHELRLILRPDARGTFHYMLLGSIFIMDVRGFPDPTEEDYRQVLEGSNLSNDARTTAMTWEGALKILDRVALGFPWFEVRPYFVHPSIAKQVLQAVFQSSSRSLLQGGRAVSIDAWQECIRKTLERERNIPRA